MLSPAFPWVRRKRLEVLGPFQSFSQLLQAKVKPLSTKDVGRDERLGRHDNDTVARTIAIFAS